VKKATDIILSADQLSVSYDKTPILWDISFEIESGQMVGIIGPNGAGKSTLLKAAMGIVRPLSGAIQFWQKPLKEVRSKIAYVPQKESVDWDFPITAFELVLMGRYGRLGIFKRLRKADKKAAMDALEIVGMASFKDRQISQLSGGQQQRLFFARALVQDADVYLMDEPFQGIDKSTEKSLVEIMRSLKKKGKTLFVVHHDLNTLKDYFDSLIMLNNRLVAYGKTEDVLNEKNLLLSFGKADPLFEEATKLSVQHFQGLK
jgi:manganese/zinc/iron transport system ATP- binding protein